MPVRQVEASTCLFVRPCVRQFVCCQTCENVILTTKNRFAQISIRGPGARPWNSQLWRSGGQLKGQGHTMAEYSLVPKWMRMRELLESLSGCSYDLNSLWQNRAGLGATATFIQTESYTVASDKRLSVLYVLCRYLLWNYNNNQIG